MFDARTAVLLHREALTTGEEDFPGRLDVDERIGRVYVPWDGVMAPFAHVTVLDTARDRVVSSSSVDNNPTVAVDTRHNRVYAVCLVNTDQYGGPVSAGSVKVLDAWKGTVLATLQVGKGPDDVAVDDRSGQVLVLDQDGVTVIAPPAAL